MTPEPGSYSVSQLTVTIAAPTDEYYFWFGVNEPVREQGPGYPGTLQIVLNRSSSIEVIVIDGDGRRWGPYNFDFTLDQKLAKESLCVIRADRTLLNGQQSVGLTFEFHRAAELDRFFYVINGASHEVMPDDLDEQQSIRVSAGPWSDDGVQTIECRVKGRQDYERRRFLVVDATPPVAHWEQSGGTIRRADWPAGLSLYAEDKGSGLAEVRLCTDNACVRAKGSGGGLFGYPTAFTDGTLFSEMVTAVVIDRVGNQTLLPAQEFSVAFAEPDPYPLRPITATTAERVSLFDYLPSQALVDEVGRLGDFSVSLTSTDIPLDPGWNDFLFRQPGKTEWESFAIYSIGLTAELPWEQADWIVYASRSTVPTLQAERVASFSGSQFAAPWWDIPQIWFVEDSAGTGHWEPGAEVCLADTESDGHGWLRRGSPLRWNGTSMECFSLSGTEEPDLEYTVSCADCAPEGQLYLQGRTDWGEFPVSFTAATGIEATELAAGADISFPDSASSHCLFYWDENENTIIDGNEPRAFLPCESEEVELVRRGGGLTVTFDEGEIQVSGMPYGGTARVVAGFHVDGTWIQRRYLGMIEDRDGTGWASLSLPPDIQDTPVGVMVTDETGAWTIAQKEARPTPMDWEEHYFAVLVDDELFAGHAGILVARDDEWIGGIYDPNDPPLLLNLPSAESDWMGMAIREGYVSVRRSGSVTYSTFDLIPSARAGQVEGQVVNAQGEPVSYANVSWAAGWYYSEMMADDTGRFSIPVLGTGTLTAVSAETGQSTTIDLASDPDTFLADLVLTLPTQPAWTALGLHHTLAGEAIRSQDGLQIVSERDGPYYLADLIDGWWTIDGPGYQRSFSFPGYMPALTSFTASATADLPPVRGTSRSAFARCGDRYIGAAFSSTVPIDAPCWQAFFEAGLDQYFLGKLDGQAEHDSTERFGTLQLHLDRIVEDYLVLHDRLLDRRLRLAAGGTLAVGVLAAGVYEVRLPDGRALLQGADQPAIVTVPSGVLSTYSLQIPVP